VDFWEWYQDEIFQKKHHGKFTRYDSLKSFFFLCGKQHHIVMEKPVLYTTYVSILVQFVTGVFGGVGLTYDVAPENEAIKTSLKLEMVVQMIQFVFYLWLLLDSDFNLATGADALQRLDREHALDADFVHDLL